MPSITPRCRRLAAFGINSLNRSNPRQHAIPRVAHHLHQQPRNRVRVRRRHICRSFSHHPASVVSFPGRSRKMFPKSFPVLVKQLRLWSLPRPPHLRPIHLARLNLIPLGVHLHQLLVGSRLQRRRQLVVPMPQPPTTFPPALPPPNFSNYLSSQFLPPYRFNFITNQKNAQGAPPSIFRVYPPWWVGLALSGLALPPKLFRITTNQIAHPHQVDSFAQLVI
jgi:hypothetical protein